MYLFIIIYLIVSLVIHLVWLKGLMQQLDEYNFVEQIVLTLYSIITSPVVFTCGIVIGLIQGITDQSEES